MPPLERFTHDYLESGRPEEGLAAQADLILADLREQDVPAALETLRASRKEDAQLIVLAEGNQFPLLAGNGRTPGRPASTWRPPSTASPAWSGIRIRTASTRRSTTASAKR